MFKLLITSLTLCASALATTYDVVTGYSADPSGQTDSSTAVQNAINAACVGTTLTPPPPHQQGGTIYFPPGRYVIGGVTYNCGNLEFAGTGSASILVPAASNSVMIAVNSSVSGNLNVRIHDLQVDGGAGTNTVKAFAFVGAVSGYPLYHARVRDCEFFNVEYAVYADRINDVWLSNLRLMDNSHIFFGSTIDGAGGDGHGWDAVIENILHYPQNGVTENTAIIQLQRAVAVHVMNFISRGLSATGKGITLLNDSQGNIIEGGSIEGPDTGVEILSNTVGMTLAAPTVTLIKHLQIDGPVVRGIYSEGDETFVSDTVVSNGDTGGHLQHLMYFQGNRSEVNNCTFLTTSGSVNGVVFQSNTKGFKIQNSHFKLQLSGGSDIIVGSGSSDYFVIDGNYRDNMDSSTAFITDLSSGGTHKKIQSLASWPN